MTEYSQLHATCEGLARLQRVGLLCFVEIVNRGRMTASETKAEYRHITKQVCKGAAGRER